MILLNSFISRISPRSALRLYNGCRFQVRIFFQRYPILIIMPFYAVKRGRVPGVYESWYAVIFVFKIIPIFNVNIFS